VAVTKGALNLVDEGYLKEQAESLKSFVKIEKDLVLGMLIGGDTKSFRLSKDLMQEVINQTKDFLEKNDAQILVTTSRRTSKEVEELVNKEFKDYPRCKLLVIANEKNMPFAVGGILGLSHIVITSAESISMISEAVNSKKYVLVFNSVPDLGIKHKRFLYNFAKNKYIYLTESRNLSKTINDIWANKPQIRSLRDNFIVNEAIKRVL
jgi:mitochondrial fission protein ELM1